MYEIVVAKKFKKAYRKLLKSGFFREETFEKVIDYLREKKELPVFNRDHALKGDFSSFRECHIESDLLLIYQVDENLKILTLTNIGSHSELFG